MLGQAFAARFNEVQQIWIAGVDAALPTSGAMPIEIPRDVGDAVERSAGHGQTPLRGMHAAELAAFNHDDVINSASSRSRAVSSEILVLAIFCETREHEDEENMHWMKYRHAGTL